MYTGETRQAALTPGHQSSHHYCWDTWTSWALKKDSSLPKLQNLNLTVSKHTRQTQTEKPSTESLAYTLHKCQEQEERPMHGSGLKGETWQLTTVHEPGLGKEQGGVLYQQLTKLEYVP